MTKKKGKKKVHIYKPIFITDICLAIISIAIDRISKYYAYNMLKDHPAVSLFAGIELKFLPNEGAAFGLLVGETSFFVLVGVIMLSAIVYFLIRLPRNKRFIPFSGLLTLIASGTLGNMIDRILYGYVVDFVYLSRIHFPIFNLADVCITISTVVLLIMLIFVYKEDDLNFLNFNEKHLREVR